jgi:hypothetical protein
LRIIDASWLKANSLEIARTRASQTEHRHVAGEHPAHCLAEACSLRMFAQRRK